MIELVLCRLQPWTTLLLLLRSSSSSSFPDMRVITQRNVVCLVFLVSRRECAVVEVTMTPDGYGGNGGGGGGRGVDGFVPTSMRSTLMLRGGRRAAAIAMLPSTILAAASLPPASLLGRRWRRRRRRQQHVECRELSRDFADRLMRLCVDAFGSNGFPRLELAKASGATFLATSYAGRGGSGGHQGQ